MAIVEPTVMKQIIGVTCSILQKNFFYENDSLASFVDDFIDELSREIVDFETFADKRVIAELHNDKMTRFYFTCGFVSTHLREFFIDKLHFTEQELIAFDSVLPKYTGEHYEKHQQKHKGTHDRKFFK